MKKKKTKEKKEKTTSLCVPLPRQLPLFISIRNFSSYTAVDARLLYLYSEFLRAVEIKRFRLFDRFSRLFCSSQRGRDFFIYFFHFFNFFWKSFNLELGASSSGTTRTFIPTLDPNPSNFFLHFNTFTYMHIYMLTYYYIRTIYSM